MFRLPVLSTEISSVTLPSNIRRKLVRLDSSEMTPTLRNRNWNQLEALHTIQSRKTKPWNRSLPNKANQRMLKRKLIIFFPYSLEVKLFCFLRAQARALLRKKPSLKELAEKCIFRDENGAHCRIASWPCKYVQSSTFVVGNFVRHFRTEHPKEARKIGFFREKSKPDPVPAPDPRIEDVTLEPMVVEQSRPVEVPRLCT